MSQTWWTWQRWSAIIKTKGNLTGPQTLNQSFWTATWLAGRSVGLNKRSRSWYNIIIINVFIQCENCQISNIQTMQMSLLKLSLWKILSTYWIWTWPFSSDSNASTQPECHSAPWCIFVLLRLPKRHPLISQPLSPGSDSLTAMV